MILLQVFLHDLTWIFNLLFIVYKLLITQDLGPNSPLLPYPLLAFSPPFNIDFKSKVKLESSGEHGSWPLISYFIYLARTAN